MLPGRNPVVAAKEIASLAAMSGGRFLPAFGLGAVDPVEQRAFGVRRRRAKMFDEMLQIMRLLDGSPAFDGVHYQVDNIRVGPVPGASMYGSAESQKANYGVLDGSEMAGCLRSSHRKMPNRAVPSSRVLAEYGREIEEDHYGVLIPYANGPVPEALLANLAKRRPNLDDPSQLVPSSWEDLCALIEQFISVGTTKFVVLPMTEPSTADEWIDHLGELVYSAPSRTRDLVTEGFRRPQRWCLRRCLRTGR